MFPSSGRSVAESGHPSFPLSPTVSVCVHWKCWRPVWQFLNIVLIDTHDPPGIPLKPNLVPFSNLNPCASNHSHKWTILLHLLAFWVHFLQAVQAKKGICYADSSQCPCCLDDSTAQRVFNCDITCSQCTSHQQSKHASYKIFNNFYGAILGSRTAV